MDSQKESEGRKISSAREKIKGRMPMKKKFTITKENYSSPRKERDQQLRELRARTWRGLPRRYREKNKGIQRKSGTIFQPFATQSSTIQEEPNKDWGGKRVSGKTKGG